MSPTEHRPIVEADLAKLRPTQITVGLAEVAQKRGQWERSTGKARRRMLDSHWFPSVVGPRNRFYVVDHHHFGFALLEEGIERVKVMLLEDLSYLEPAVFWRFMEQRDWAHPFDEQGERRDYGAIPAHISQLVDDPYRSLAGFLRNAGGYAKDAAPFAEFLWADYLRPHITRGQIQKSMEVAVREGLGLAKSPLARYLPGWSGVTPATSRTAR